MKKLEYILRAINFYHLKFMQTREDFYKNEEEYWRFQYWWATNIATN